MYKRIGAIFIGMCFIFVSFGVCDSTVVAKKNDPQKTAAPRDSKTLKPQETCPVMGNKINKKYFVDVDGNRIYMCCPGCESTIKKNPEKYIKILEKQGEGVETIGSKESVGTK